MKKILTTIVLTILLAGCATNKESEIILESEPTKEDEIFQKNMKCFSLQETIEKRIQERAKEYADINEEWSLEEIFYSPKLNSCLYVIYQNHLFENQDSIYEKWMYDVLNDGPSSGAVDFCFEATTEVEESGCEEFEQKIKELKQA
jgi:hypothetical protein